MTKPIPGWAHDAVRDLRPLMSLEEVADALGVSKRTVGRYAAGGALKTIRLAEGGSGRVRVARATLARFLAERAR